MLKPLDVLHLYPAHDATLPGAFHSRMRGRPERRWLMSAGREWSWRTFDGAVQRGASVLAARGVRRGDRVGIVARNSDTHLGLLFALARLRAIMVPVNPALGVDEARYVLDKADVAGVVASQETYALVRAACAPPASRPWFMLHDGDAADAPNFWGLVERAHGARPRDRPEPDDTCLIIFTSGTTGFPKGVMHSQRNFIASGEAFVERMCLQPDDRVMIVLPLFHVNALFYSVAGALAAGCSVIVVPRFSASSFWTTAAETGATEVNIIEAIGTILRNRPRNEFRPDHRICKIYGVRANVAGAFREEFGIAHLVGGYGMTEIPGVTCNPFDGVQKLESMGPVGRHPDPSRPWAECRVVDDEGRDVPPNEIGELIVKTPIVMQGYFGEPEQTRVAFHDGWFLTGDLVRRDEDGYFFFVSRKRDVIRRRGENIAGAELDRVLGAHPAVLEAAAIPVPSELGEDDILAAVVRRPGHRVTAEELALWCRERLAPMKVPRFVVFLNALPHTPTHKVAKMALRADPSLRARAVDLAPRHSPGQPAPGACAEGVSKYARGQHAQAEARLGGSVMPKPDSLRTDIAWSTRDRITVKGLDLARDILGKLDLGQMAFLELTGRLPTPKEAVVFNAAAVALVEHGITPSVLAARMTYTGAPEAMQAAVAAGLCGLGSVFVGSMEGAARMLQDAIPDPKRPGEIEALARRIIDRFRERGEAVPGLGHRLHTPVDPRVPRLFEIARDNGCSGPFVALMQAIARQAEASYGKALPVNATGAIGAIASELGLPWKIVRGIGVLARAIGLVGHILEEMSSPMAREIAARVDGEATAHLRAGL